MKRLIWLALVASTVQGCASSADPHDPPFMWRRAMVVAVGTGQSLGPPKTHDCRPASGTPAAADEPLFAVVQYFSGRTSVVQVVPLEAGLLPAVGDQLEIGRFGCRSARRPESR